MNSRHLRKLNLACSLLMMACVSKSKQRYPDSNLSMFFPQATREDAGDFEKYIVRIGACSGFFIQSERSDYTYVMSANHCSTGYYRYKKGEPLDQVDAAQKWCKEEGVISDYYGVKGKCENLAVHDRNLDNFIMAFKMEKAIPNSQKLRLAVFDAPEGSRLSMIGYPTDRFRTGKATVTANCWLFGGEMDSPFLENNDFGRLHDRVSWHNCSVYGGNSGGPIILEGTDLVLAEPFNYDPSADEHDHQFSGIASFLSLVKDLAHKQAAAMAEHKIVLVAKPPQTLLMEGDWKKKSQTLIDATTEMMTGSGASQ